MKNRYLSAMFNTSYSPELESLIQNRNEYHTPQSISDCYRESIVIKLLWEKVSLLTTLAKIFYFINLVLGIIGGVMFLALSVGLEAAFLLLFVPVSVGLFWLYGKQAAFFFNNKALSLVAKIGILQHCHNADSLALYFASQKETPENTSAAESVKETPENSSEAESVIEPLTSSNTSVFHDSTEDDLNQMVFCEKCWKKVPASKPFCPHCGASITATKDNSGRMTGLTRFSSKRKKPRRAENILTNQQGEFICPHCFQRLPGKVSVCPHCDGKLLP